MSPSELWGVDQDVTMPLTHWLCDYFTVVVVNLDSFWALPVLRKPAVRDPFAQIIMEESSNVTNCQTNVRVVWERGSKTWNTLLIIKLYLTKKLKWFSDITEIVEFRPAQKSSSLKLQWNCPVIFAIFQVVFQEYFKRGNILTENFHSDLIVEHHSWSSSNYQKYSLKTDIRLQLPLWA